MDQRNNRTEGRRNTLRADWKKLFDEHLPGYDPVATAAPGDWFDDAAADKVVGFFRDCLKFIEGEKAGQPFLLEPWQKALVGCMFGWKRQDGLRRYREVMVYVPRKNGKTPLLAGLVLYVMFCDHEPGAQIYSAAAEREQAALVYRHAAGMVLREPELEARAKIYKTFKSIEFAAEGTTYKALSADADTKHGFSSHFVVVDELHAHPNGELVDVLQTSTAARSQPMMVYITTADYARLSVCNKRHDYARKVRDGIIKDSSFLPCVYEATLEDDWTSEDVWRKANPNYAVSVKPEYLVRECERAKNEPSYENTFKRLHLNIVTEQNIRWLQMAPWDACNGELPNLDGLPCYGGLDLSSTRDLTAFVLAFPVDEQVYLMTFPFIPGDTAQERERSDRVPVLTWAREGHIELTPGASVDYRAVRNKIVELGERYDIRQIAYDRWGADQLRQELEGDGFEIFACGQGFASLSAPSKELERLMIDGRLVHGGHPVLRWCASNATIEGDAAGNIKPSKKKSTERIDCIVAAVMAISCIDFTGGSVSYQAGEMFA